MEIEFNIQNKAQVLKLSETGMPNVLSDIIACLLLKFSQYRDHLCTLIHFTVDCMPIEHIGKKVTVIRIHQTLTVVPFLKASEECHSMRSIHELSETVKDKI